MALKSMLIRMSATPCERWPRVRVRPDLNVVSTNELTEGKMEFSISDMEVRTPAHIANV